jgi:UDP-glucose 4-epimerase
VKAIIFGASGLLGRSITKTLSANHIVYAVSRSVVDDWLNSDSIIQIQQDICDFNIDGFTVKDQIDVAYYLAQSSSFRLFPEQAFDVFSVNIEGLFKAIHWAYQNQIRKFVLASSGGVYGSGNINGSSHSESTIVPVNRPLGFYLGSKMCAEIIVQNYAPYFENMVILRPFFIYGPGQNDTMLIPRLLKSVVEGKPIEISGNNGIYINPVFVDDAAAAFIRAKDLAGFHLINVGGKEIVSLREIVTLMGEVTGKKPVFKIISKDKKEPDKLLGDIDVMCRELSEPLVKLRDGLKIMWADMGVKG